MRDTLEMIGIGVLVVGVTVLFIFGIREASRQYHKCVDNGGHFERYNCRQVEYWNCTTDGSGNVNCMSETSEHCDERCVGASAEEQP